MKTLGSIVCRALPWFNQELVPHVFDCFMIALEDYTVDERGAWVREAVMSGIECLSLALLSVGVGKVQETHHFPGDDLPGEAGHENDRLHKGPQSTCCYVKQIRVSEVSPKVGLISVY